MAQFCAASVAAIALLVLTGWFVGVPALARMVPGTTTMKVNSALGFLAGAVCVTALARPGPRAERVAMAAGLFVLIDGTAHLVEYLFGIDLGIDQALFRDAPSAVHPGRMAPNTAFALMLAGCAALMSGRRVGRVWPSNPLAVALTVVGVVAVLGRVLDISQFYDVNATGPLTPMAVPAAVSAALLGVGLLLVRPNRGLLGLVNSYGPVGAHARRLLPAVVILPTAIIVLDWELHRLGLYGTQVTILIMICSVMTLMAALALLLTRQLSDAEGARQLTLAELQESHARTRQILETAHQAYIAIDEDGTILNWNPSAERTFGWSREEVLGRSLADTVIPERHRQRHTEGLERFLSSGEGPLLGRRTEIEALHRDGHELPVELTISPLHTKDGWHFNAFLQDISERRGFERDLRHLAEHDPLTGALNPRVFQHEMQSQLARNSRYGVEGAVLMIDLDHLKYYNDTLGHSAGDEVITGVADALRKRLRQSDVFARLGGDEFAVILPHEDPEGAERVAVALAQSVHDAASAMPHDRDHSPTVSIGVAMFTDGLSAKDALIQADRALYQSKELGRDRVCLHESELGERAKRRRDQQVGRAPSESSSRLGESLV